MFFSPVLLGLLLQAALSEGSLNLKIAPAGLSCAAESLQHPWDATSVVPAPRNTCGALRLGHQRASAQLCCQLDVAAVRGGQPPAGIRFAAAGPCRTSVGAQQGAGGGSQALEGRVWKVEEQEDRSSLAAQLLAPACGHLPTASRVRVCQPGAQLRAARAVAGQVVSTAESSTAPLPAERQLGQARRLLWCRWLRLDLQSGTLFACPVLCQKASTQAKALLPSPAPGSWEGFGCSQAPLRWMFAFHQRSREVRAPGAHQHHLQG